jgi:hypothetical protein
MEMVRHETPDDSKILRSRTIIFPSLKRSKLNVGDDDLERGLRVVKKNKIDILFRRYGGSSLEKVTISASNKQRVDNIQTRLLTSNYMHIRMIVEATDLRQFHGLTSERSSLPRSRSLHLLDLFNT